MYCIADDMLVCGIGSLYEEAVVDHDNNVRMFLRWCREKIFYLNREKMKVHKESLPFIGLKPSCNKVDVILQMPQPTDVNGVNYLGKFVNNLCESQ